MKAAAAAAAANGLVVAAAVGGTSKGVRIRERRPYLLYIFFVLNLPLCHLVQLCGVVSCARALSLVVPLPYLVPV
jgi:hypothetical protein